MRKLIDKISVNGYNPFGIFNLILAALASGGTAVIYIGLGEYPSLTFSDIVKMQDVKICLGVIVVSSLLLLLRNLIKLKSIPKTIIFTIITLVFGLVICVIGVVALVLGGMFAGTVSGTGSSNSNNTPVNHNGFTDDQERAAGYAGFNNAYEAQQAGAKWDNNSQSWLK